MEAGPIWNSVHQGTDIWIQHDQCLSFTLLQWSERRNIGGCIEGHVHDEGGKVEWREGHLESSLVHIASFTGAPCTRREAVYHRVYRTCYSFHYLWVSDYETDHLYHFDPGGKATKIEAGISGPVLPSGFVCVLPLPLDNMRLAWMGGWVSCCTLQVNTHSDSCTETLNKFQSFPIV